ncbi:hypothetical protein BGX28_004208 [Mortierella sp. GBA30]|nr:hypothetical protein BGX28_004208 [Mortierella sp. GBA30]
MILLRTILSIAVLLLLATHADVAPTKIKKRSFLPNAPLSNDIDGAHMLLKNDVDSSDIKNAMLLLSKPRGYYEGISACLLMGDGGYIYIPGTSGAIELVSLLNNNANAQKEVSAFFQFCVMRRVLPFEDTSRQIKVNTSVGLIQGWRDQNSFRFLGIPYGEAPVEQLRFAAPVPKAPFASTLDAIHYRSICPQITQSAGFIPLLLSYLENGATEQEDCLNLNVYTPSLKGLEEELLPVMFYIHGGGFANFSGSLVIYEPGNLVSRGGVVAVTINYRLGMLGWMENTSSWSRSSIPGNQAFRDQILALKWVQQNIRSFGGDPNRVTVFGQSAGATSIRALLSAPSTFSLYQSVISESDPINIPFNMPESAKSVSTYFMQALDCPVDDLDCARSRSVEEVLKAQSVANSKGLMDNKWTTWALVERPTVDGDLIPAEFSALVKSGTYNAKANIMWGTTKDEAAYYTPQYFSNPIIAENAVTALEQFFDANRTRLILNSPYFQLDPSDSDAVRNLITRLGTQYYFFCPLRYLSRQMTKIKPVYNFRFNRGRDFPVVGDSYCSSSTGRVCHGNDIQSVFASGASVFGFSQTGDDAQFARQVVDRLTTFAKTGNPNPRPGQPGTELSNPDVTSVSWPPYDDTNPIMELDVKGSVSEQAENDVCSWIDTTFLYDFWRQIPGNFP